MSRFRNSVLRLLPLVMLVLGGRAAVGAQRGGLGVKLDRGADGRLAVTAVTPGGGADQAGVKAGDVLVGVNGKAVAGLAFPEGLRAEVAGPVGSRCDLTLERDGKKIEVAVRRTPSGGKTAPVAPAPAGAGPPVPDPNPLLATIPQAAGAGPPAVIRPGTRLVYYGASASVPGSRTELVLDDKGRWVNKRTGKKYREQHIPGVGGAGYNVVRVGYVDRKVAVLSGSSYTLDPTDNSTMFHSSRGMVTNAGMGADYWVNPKALAAVKEMDQDGVRILRMPYVVRNRRYNAIRFQTSSAKGYTAYLYDLDTGLMIFYGSSSQSTGVLTPPLGKSGPIGLGAGSTGLVTSWLMEVKQVPLPWQDAPAPAWVGQFRELRYQGAQSSVMAGVTPFSRPMSILVTAKARGAGWVRAVSDMTIATLGGMPPEQHHTDIACAGASLGGLWVSPRGLAALKRGQVIETNQVTATKTVVADVGPGDVTISEIGKKHILSFSYDTKSGVLAAYSLQQQIGLATTTLRTRLAGKR